MTEQEAFNALEGRYYRSDTNFRQMIEAVQEHGDTPGFWQMNNVTRLLMEMNGLLGDGSTLLGLPILLTEDTSLHCIVLQHEGAQPIGREWTTDHE